MEGAACMYAPLFVLLSPVGLVGVLCVYLVIGFGAGLVVNLLGFVYPAYKS